MKGSTKITTLAVLVGVIGTSAISFADDLEKNEMPMEGKFREGLKEIHQAVRDEDYTAWYNLLVEKGVSDEEKLSEERFNDLVAVDDLIEEGKREEARELAEELGMEPGKMRKGMKKHRMHERKENREEMRAAVAAGDYGQWAELMADHPRVEEMVTEENFAKLQEAHQLAESGDKEGAKEIMKELHEQFRPER